MGSVTEAFGRRAADELAAWAIDVLAGPHVPVQQHATAWAAKVPWSEIKRGRELLERAGIDWEQLAAASIGRRRERERRWESRRRELGLSAADFTAALEAGTVELYGC